MAAESVRWRNVREFLDDLPTVHCTVKPEHEYCTVCMRINYLVAHDCPLYHQKPKRKPRRPQAPDEARPEPLVDRVTADDIKHILEGEDFPIIEFAGPRGAGADKDDGEIIDVEPIDVSPITDAPSKAKEAVVGKKERTAPAAPERDPETIVQEIMEELELPGEEGLEEEPGEEKKEPSKKGKPPKKGPAEEGEGDEKVEEKGDEKVEEKAPKEEAEPEEPSPPVVEKQAVRKLRPRSEKD